MQRWNYRKSLTVVHFVTPLRPFYVSATRIFPSDSFRDDAVGALASYPPGGVSCPAVSSGTRNRFVGPPFRHVYRQRNTTDRNFLENCFLRWLNDRFVWWSDKTAYDIIFKNNILHLYTGRYLQVRIDKLHFDYFRWTDRSKARDLHVWGHGEERGDKRLFTVRYYTNWVFRYLYCSYDHR